MTNFFILILATVVAPVYLLAAEPVTAPADASIRPPTETGVVQKLETRMEVLEKSIDARLAATESKVDTKLGTIDTKINAAASNIDTKLNASVGNIDTKINSASGNIDTKITAADKSWNAVSAAFQAAQNQISASQKSLDWWFSFASLFLTILGIFFAGIGVVIPFVVGKEQRKQSTKTLKNAHREAKRTLQAAVATAKKIETEMDERIKTLDVLESKAEAAAHKTEKNAEKSDSILEFLEKKIHGKFHGEKMDDIPVENINSDKGTQEKLKETAIEFSSAKKYDIALPLWEMYTDICAKNDPDAYTITGLTCRMAYHQKRDLELLSKACKYFQERSKLTPPENRLFGFWGSTVLEIAKRMSGKEKNTKLNEARDILLCGEKEINGYCAYDLACLSVIEGNQEDAEKWLKISRDTGNITSKDKEHIQTDPDLAPLRELPWFKDFLDTLKK